MNAINARRIAILAAMGLALGACSLTADYTASEAKKDLAVTTTTTQLNVRFHPGSAVLAPADAARLRRMAASGAIAPADRITVSAAGSPWLAKQRVGAVASQLLHSGVVVSALPLSQVPRDHALVEVARSLVTLPPCPDWSKNPGPEFSNTASSNYGCATQTNLGLMVADPGDLASGRPLAPASGQPAAAAVNRYFNDKVTPLQEAGKARAFSSSSSTQTPAGGQ